MSFNHFKSTFRLIIVLTLLSFESVFAQSITSDNGDGTFTNPVVNIDMPDPDIIRVGEYFYMVSSSFTSMPGIPIHRSKDLIHWEIIAHAYDSLKISPEYDLENNKHAYRWGSWAPCIRYNKGKYYIFFNEEFNGFFVATASRPEGPYTLKKFGFSFYDPSVLFDDDGKIYVVHGNANIMIAEVDSGFNHIIQPPKRVYTSAFGNNNEGSHIYKRNGFYYITTTARGYDGLQICMRSKNIFGPYEAKIICADDINYGGAGMHQGGFIDINDGRETWFFMFQDRDYVGRVAILQPVRWIDGFPYIGDSSGRGFSTCKKPNLPFTPVSNNMVGRDNFDSPVLSFKWAWNHNPLASHWSLTHKKGFLSLKAKHANGLMWAKNTLTQKVVGGGSIVVTKMNLEDLQPNDMAGLCVLNLPYASVAVKQLEGIQSIQMFENDQLVERKDIKSTKEIWFKATLSEEGTVKFSYSADGLIYHSIGSEFVMEFTVKTFMGNRVGVFCYNSHTSDKTGTVHVDFVDIKPYRLKGNHYQYTEKIPATQYDSEVGAIVSRLIPKRPIQCIDNVVNDNWLGYHYIHFDQPSQKINLKVLPQKDAEIEIYVDKLDQSPEQKLKIPAETSKAFKTYSVPLAIPKGTHRIYFKFKSEFRNALKFESFGFE